MLQGKKAYICSPLSAPNPEGVQHNMELAKYYLIMKTPAWFMCM